tara:strand:+ start:309 stop:1646 length:1338 start_codon:yes stop_codon:yes gene_type:complete
MTLNCSICDKEFKTLYLLKRHQQKKYVCEKKTDETHIYQCNICNYKFKLIQNYNRHINNKICNKSKPNKSKNNIITNNTINNNDNTNNGTIDNRQINITNNIIIQHINPFGQENTDFLSNKEKLEILRSGHKACIKILKIVYNRNENKNFYKVNKKHSTISYLKYNSNNDNTNNTNNTNDNTNNTNDNNNDNTNNNNNSNEPSIDVFQLREFRKEIFNNSTTLLYSIMIDCKNDLCFEEQLALMDNITTIKNDVYNEIFNNSLSNLRKELGECILDTETKNEINWGIENVISYETDNNNDKNRKQISNYVKQINDKPIVKDIFTTQVSKQKEKRHIINKELNDNSIENSEINQKYGKVEYGELANQLQLSHYPNTKFVKKLNEREKLEETLVKNENTLGKLNAYNNMKKDRGRNIKHILKHENNIKKLKELSNNDELDIEHIISS